MHCHNCGRQISEGSGFCPYCGAPQNRTVAPQPAARPVPPAPARPPMGYVPPVHPAPPVPPMPPTPPVPREEPVLIQEVPEVSQIPVPPIQEYIPVTEEPKQKDKKPRKPFPVLALILGLLLVASLALSVYLYLGWQDSLQAYEICEDQLEDAQEEYDELLQSYNHQSDEVDALEEELDEISVITDALDYQARNGAFGRIADNFRTDSAIYVVSKNSTDTKLTLWANWPNGGTVYVNYDGEAAMLEFDQNSWKTSTTMTLKPQQEGYTVATFSNNVDSKTFSILIIVTD